jgi:hypothetical protein
MSEEDHQDLLGEWDDADDAMYDARLAQWKARRRQRSAAGAPFLAGQSQQLPCNMISPREMPCNINPPKEG